MISTEDMPKTIHQGRNIKRFREMLGLKQDALAAELGDDWSQKKVSMLEAKETIEQNIIEQVAKVMKIPVDAIKNFDEDQAINIISNTFDNGSFINTGHNPTFNVNPMEKWLEALEENKRLYEALLKSEREKVSMLEKMLTDVKKK
jgi:transcriptional regulator with XRE-family HTH domain